MQGTSLIIDALLKTACGDCAYFRIPRLPKDDLPAGRLAHAIRRQDVSLALKVLREAAVAETSEMGEVIVRAAKVGDPNEKCRGRKQTALHCAVKESQVELVKGLIRAGAFVDKSDIELARSMRSARAEEVHRVMEREMCVQRTRRFSECLVLLQQVQLFANLHCSELPMIATECTYKTFKAGEIVIQQGTRGNELFMIHAGSVSVSVETPVEGGPNRCEQVATLGAGDSFGEAALQTDAPRNATVVAASNLEVYILSRATFNDLGLRYRLMSFRKRAVLLRSRYSDTEVVEPTTRTKTDTERDLVISAMKANHNLACLIDHIEDDRLRLIADQAFRVDVQKGVEVVKQRDLKADLFYVVQSGLLEVHKDGEKVGELGAGASFGELALIFRVPRAATVTAVTATTLWSLRRQDLRAIMQAPLKAKLQEFMRIVEEVPLLKDAPDTDLVASALVETTFVAGEEIIRQGDVGNTLFIVRDGEVVVEKNGVEVKRLHGHPATGDFEVFGERALLNDEPRAATVRAVSRQVKVLALDRSIFELVTAAAGASGESQRGHWIEYSEDALDIVGVLGSGSFGKVELVTCKRTGQTFALKSLSKGHLVDVGAHSMVLNEKRIMRMTESPFIVRLVATFERDQELDFLMEPMLGGDLFEVYSRFQLDGSEPHARFYSACTALALEHLHARQIVYRDLKPENLLLDQSGYCKVADFGLAKFVVGQTYTVCGTPSYFAPEMILSNGHSHSVDWWALGVLTYELMVGDTPFNAVDLVHTMRMVQRGISSAYFPEPEKDWVAFVKDLCRNDPEDRLPMGDGGITNLLEHPWYAESGFDWEAVRLRSLPAPFVPEERSLQDMVNLKSKGHEPPSLCFDGVDSSWFKDFHDPWGPRLDVR